MEDTHPQTAESSLDDFLADAEVQELARQFTQQSTELERTGTELSRVSTRLSQISATGENPFGDEDPKLDPNSTEFNAKHWIKNLRLLQDKDPDHYKPYRLGVAYRNLQCYGGNVDADYQGTVPNVLGKALRFFKELVVPSKDTFDIIKAQDANIEPGELVVVFGRPGAGCTSLLKTIAAQTYGFHVAKNSEMTYNGLTQSDIRGRYRGEVIYNAETEIHFPHLTVWQTLYFAALMKVPENRVPGVSRQDYASHFANVYLAMFGLSHRKDTKVGGAYVRGVSGGERKRVSITEASVCGSKLQCWDNATRGLDAASALEFVKALRISCSTLEIASLVSIYQCSQDAYNLFDKVILLYEGRQIFFGDIHRAKGYFIRMGFHCPERQTVPDFLTSITSASERIPEKGFEHRVPRTAEEFETAWKKSPEYAELAAELDDKFNSINSSHDELTNTIHAGHRAEQAKHVPPLSPYTVSYFMQVRYLTGRAMLRIRNNWSEPVSLIVSNFAIALILGSIFYNLKDSTSEFYHRGACLFFACLFNSFNSLLEVVALYEARGIVEKHKQYGMYHPSAEAVASIISEFPNKLATSLSFNITLYFMVNLKREAGAFWFFFLNAFTSTFVMSHIFRMIGSMTKNLAQAMTPASLILLGLSTYVGFIVPTDEMLGWSRWINYIDPVAYTFEAMMVNEFHGRNVSCGSFVPQGGSYDELPMAYRVCSTVGSEVGKEYVSGDQYLLESFGYKWDHRWRNWGIQMGYVVFFFFFYTLFTEFNPSARQKGEKIVFQLKTLRKLRKLQRRHKDVENSDEKLTTEDDLDSRESTPQSAPEHHMGGDDIFHWRNVSYQIPWKGSTRTLLSQVDGWVKPGTLTALMGASGAGKTTLLDVLADRVTMGVVTGDMLVNGHPRTSSFQRSTGYVQQLDLHLETSTVREALMFSAHLRQPSSVPEEEKVAYVREVIRILDMEKYADAVVGVPGEGLNVEQRKRLTIGVELAAKPQLLLFLDEPTSGLDSQTAWSICQLMKKLSNEGQAILCTIHQPSAMLFQQFDRLLLLQPGGETVYYGDIGEKATTLIQYFEKNGSIPCPKDDNPAEWMLKAISHGNTDWHTVWMQSPERAGVQAELDRMDRELVKRPMEMVDSNSSFAVPLWMQYRYVTKRVFEQYWRTPSYIWAKIIKVVLTALFNGFTFFQANRSIQGMQNQMFAVFMYTTMFATLVQQMLPHFVAQRELYEARERPSKTFSWVAFILAQISVELPWMVLVGTMGFFCWYYPIGFQNNAALTGATHVRGVQMWLFVVLFTMYTSTMGQLCICGLEVQTTAGHIATFLFAISLSFCGVLVTKADLPGFWIFMYRCSPFTYWISGVLSTGLANAKVTCSSKEILSFPTFNSTACGEYMAPYMAVAGGYLVDPESTTTCEYCSLAKTNVYLDSINAPYSESWRNLGIFIAYIVINATATCAIYYLARVPKKVTIEVIRHWIIKRWSRSPSSVKYPSKTLN
ncbi:unnamed protein product [Kuraishia capsulata CBS 1993]|uniref:ABC transporter domain-containing protein n=1 Tax=Kuraishia capsulata CBS 1993 TaxID=1382522 RepID=W6MKH4_9ASCO|nr:uncharacterized protein KUCA_T00002845001 [Kuraishia capsulata CBS 1993]CDK26871.1 unnamed protein product [Kuraishia capsulata CBS 1993]